MNVRMLGQNNRIYKCTTNVPEAFNIYVRLEGWALHRK
jgi:hypothetical protein